MFCVLEEESQILRETSIQSKEKVCNLGDLNENKSMKSDQNLINV
jgi:hypothetical protein